MKRQIYTADANRQKLSNKMGFIDVNKKGELKKYLLEQNKIFPEAIWFKIWGFDNFLLISEYLK